MQRTLECNVLEPFGAEVIQAILLMLRVRVFPRAALAMLETR